MIIKLAKPINNYNWQLIIVRSSLTYPKMTALPEEEKVYNLHRAQGYDFISESVKR